MHNFILYLNYFVCCQSDNRSHRFTLSVNIIYSLIKKIAMLFKNILGKYTIFPSNKHRMSK